jgi:NitT/TauT family transport system substrate-binding protein
MRRRITALGAALLAGALLAGCGGGGAAEAEPTGAGGETSVAGQTTKVTVGVIPILDVAPIYLGVDKGIFEQHGLDVTLETAQGGAAIVPAVLSGQYQFGFSNNTSLLLAQAQGLPLKIVAPGSSSTSVQGEDFAGVVVRADSDIKKAADLAGKSVAINTLNNISDTVVRESVRKDGGDPTGIKFVELPFPDMPAAVAEGRVDAAFVVEPFLAISEGQEARDVASAYALPTEDLSVATYFTSEEAIQSKPELVKAFTAAMVESQRYASENPDEVRRIITTYTKIDPGLIDQLTLPAFPSEVNTASIQVLADLALTDGLLKQPADVEALIRR